MPLGSHLPSPAGLAQCVKEAHCESPGAAALLVACVGGSGGEGSGSQRLQWFACCTCETCYPTGPCHPRGPCGPCAPCKSCDPCYPYQSCDRCGSSPDLCVCCGAPNAFPPRWRRLPPLPPTNPHSDPACYGAVAAAVPGTGFAIVGGAVRSQSGKPQHVRHVSVFDWHMGAWFDVQQPCMLPRLDPVVAGMGGVRWNGGQRDCLVVVGGCAVPSFPRASAAGSCGGGNSSSTQQYYQFPRLDSLVLGGRAFVRRYISPCFGLNPGGFNRHTHSGSMVSEAGVLEADWESAEMWRVVGESDAIHAIWTRTHVAQVIVADVTGTGDVTVAGVTLSAVTARPGAEGNSTKARSSAACHAAPPEALQTPLGGQSSRTKHATHATPATYSVLCSLDPSHSLLVFNHLHRKWVPAGPRLSSPSPPRPPLPRPSPHVLYPCRRGSHGGHCSTLPCPPTPPYPLVPPCSPVPPCAPAAPLNLDAATLNPHLPSCASNNAASSLVVPNSAAATSASAAAAAAAATAAVANSGSAANLGRLRQLVGCEGRLLALFQPHDPSDPHDPGRSLFALSQPPPTVEPPPPQAQASESVSVAAAGELMRLVNIDRVGSRIGWEIGAPVALPGNGRLHHMLSVAI
ncbi:unnamed protein product [Closterium sp. Naga37s-1]|nr:unnamed protein product [Closterium sp. Naga37s-1]